METGRETPQGPDQYFELVNGNRTFRNNWLANDIEDDFNFVYVKDTERFYIYTGKYWEEKAERKIKEECNHRLGDEYTPARANKVVDTIKTRGRITHRKEDFQPNKNKIPFNNGYYNLETEELEEHKPEDNFTHIIPWDYNPEAQCPKINEFLDDILENEKDKETIIETIGYSLLADYPYAHALILYGGGNNGKSVLLDLWKKILSEDNYKEEQLQQLEKSRFATQSLYRKLAVFNDDLPSTELETGSTLKALTGGGDIRAEYKGGAHFQFSNYATPVFACNEIPGTKDTSDGFFRRWEIINFPYEFKDNPVTSTQKKKVPKDQLIPELTKESEIEGLLNEAVIALELIKENGGFTYKTSPEDTETLWKSYSNPVEQFLEVCIEQGMTQQDARELDGEPSKDLSEYSYDFIKKDDLVFLINKYCEHFDSKAPSKTAITQKLKNDSPYYVQEGRTRQLGSDNKRTRVYKFIKFTDEFVDFVLKNEKRPDCPYFFENLRAHAGNIVQSYKKSQDTQDRLSLKDKIKEFIEKQRGDYVEEEELIDSINEDREKLDEKISDLINKGVIYRPKPGKVSTI